ncbi:unnamed protein product [[Candida] boidinii]|nr:unnamed protein product [[Candida] boidinii]
MRVVFQEFVIPNNQNPETPNKSIPIIDKNRFPLKKQPYQQAINTNILKTDITPEKTSAVTTKSIYSTQSGISSSSINKKNSSLINSTPSNNLHKLLDTDKLQNNTESAITKLSSNNPFLDSRFLDDDDDDDDVNEDGYEYVDKDLENVDGNKDKSIKITKPTQFSEIVNVFGIAPNKVRSSSNHNSSSTVNKSSISGSTSIGTADEEYFDVEDTTPVLAHAELAVSNHHYANSPISPTKPAMNTSSINSLNNITNNRESENSKKEEKELEFGDGLGNRNDYIRTKSLLEKILL